MAEYEQRFIDIGLKIAYYRKKRCLTQEQLSEMVDINPNYLSRVETPNYAQPVSLKTLFALADALGIEPYVLLKTD